MNEMKKKYGINKYGISNFSMDEEKVMFSQKRVFDHRLFLSRENKINLLPEFHQKELFISTDTSEVDKERVMVTFIFRTFWRISGFVTQLQNNVETDA